ncbi:MAG: hypothetical protein EA418_10485 [Wenzhouxiangellaceae bacterium]|nr:MAG: hypothetical protein EA418_10485 [Wenzhouxiangellaceae bacterium]
MNRLPASLLAIALLALPFAGTAADDTIALDGLLAGAYSGSTFEGGHRCAHDGSRVWCWGSNNAGQLGLGHTIDTSLATVVPGLQGATTRFRPGIAGLGLGGRHSCAVKDQRVNCWGDNQSGQLGTGDLIDRLKPALIALPPLASGDFAVNIVSIGTGLAHSCAQASGGASWCWGDNQNGQTGSDPEIAARKPVPVDAVTIGIVEQWALGDAYSCYLSQGEVWCWGSNSHGQLGDGTLQSRHEPARVVGLPDTITMLSAGPRHLCASDGNEVYCWGANERAQVGLASSPGNERVTTPVAISGLAGELVDLALSQNRSCAATNTEVWCWGAAWLGQAGQPDEPMANLSWQVDEAITALPDQECALAGQKMICINSSGRGQWASPRAAHRVADLPLLTPGAPDQPGLVAGEANACIVFAHGDVYCWGNNSFGQLAQSDTDPRDNAVLLSLPGGATPREIGIGSHHICATSDSGLYCWGSNFFKALGRDDVPESATPLAAPISISPASRLIAGFGFNCLWEPGTREPLRCWGQVIRGMAAFAPEGQSTVAHPFDIPVPGQLEMVQAGREHLCMLVEIDSGEREVYCLGDIQTSSDYYDTPAPLRYALRRVVTGLGSVQSIQAAAFSQCALGGSGVSCWGMDHASTTGMRGNRQPPGPVQFPEAIDPAGDDFHFAVGGRHVCAADGGQNLCIGLPQPLSCNHAVAMGEIGPGSGFVGCAEEESRLTAAERDWMTLAGLPASPASTLISGNEYSCSIQGAHVHCWGWGAAVTAARGLEAGQPRPVLRQASIEPAATAAIDLDFDQACPAFILASTRLLDPLDSDSAGNWGMEVLLRDGDTRLHGGLNFGGFARLADSGYAAFRIDNNGQGPQRVRIEAEGNGDQFVLEISSSAPVGSPQETLFSELVTLDESPALIDIDLEEGFHVIRFRSLFSEDPALFLVRARTVRMDGSPASFRYGAVVGGYIEPGLSGFAGLCTDGAGSVLVRSQGNRTRGPRGAGDLRIRVENRTSGELIIDSAAND